MSFLLHCFNFIEAYKSHFNKEANYLSFCASFAVSNLQHLTVLLIDPCVIRSLHVKEPFFLGVSS